MNIIKEVEPNSLFERLIEEKRKYSPRNTKIKPITKDKKKGPKFTYDECIVFTHMVIYPDSTYSNECKDNIQVISEMFNRSKGSISMTLSNTKSVLFKTSKLTNVSNNLKMACEYSKNLSKNDFDRLTASILLNYDYNAR